MEDKWSAGTLHLPRTRLFDIFIVPLKELASCVLLCRDPQRPCPECLYLFLITDTRYNVKDIKGALLKQLKASKDTSLSVKKPTAENIHFTNYGNVMWT